ncbi:Protein disulfide-isomerase A5 [Orchesella cincta]|uniref:Protein disulfide-isomerase A5 n=1 Tax=Orchesella cincta TaxID=48709 RepID=A0A1D2MEP7_ORCCI|nr:Protein disulfide-isomerase A5 [Orchesella cincta]
MNNIILWTVILLCSLLCVGGNGKGKVTLESLTDVKDHKKLIKIKTNVLVCFGNGRASFTKDNILNLLTEAANEVKGLGTIAVADCSGDVKKKLCKKVKVLPDEGQYIIKHYNNGEYNKDYDRAIKISSLVNFMRDPTGDLPWDEDETAKDVVHLVDNVALQKLLKKENTSGKGILVMFYAPWCGYCKRMKPDYSSAATELISTDAGILAAIDVNKAENNVVRQKYNITGFPTLLYFRNGQLKQHYEGENNKDALVNFMMLLMKNPDAPPVEKPKEPEWSDEPSEVVHLTGDTFDTTLQENPSVLVMFYAPWCGHCKRMKPTYVTAAAKLKEEKITGILAAVDATKDNALAKRFDVQGYPTVKYFKDGELAFDAGNIRDEEAIINFMKDPKEPPPPPPPEKSWAEEESAVAHLTEESFKPTLRKKKRALVMFYAPWCGHCKAAKPEFTAAAEELKDDPKILLGAVDCTIHRTVCEAYDVKGYPTFKLFHYYNKADVESFDGARTKTGFLEEMRPNMAANGDDWVGLQGGGNVHILTDSNIGNFIKSQEATLIMYYAPWCGHCKSAKPEYAKAAEMLTKEAPGSVLAAVDCMRYPSVYEEYEIVGYPTFKYYRSGRLIGEYHHRRRAADFVHFMMRKPKSRDEL